MERLLTCFMACVCSLTVPRTIHAQGTPRDEANLTARELSASFRKAVEHVRPSIVTIETLSASQGDRPAAESLEFGDGTGLIVHADGWILTNRHAVTDADAIRLRLADGREYWAEEIREDEWSDLALILIPARNLPAATFGDSNKVQVGDWVVSAGNSFGLGLSVNAGTVSATRRRVVDTNLSLLQTNAISNPGNSGAPLLNLNGEVVGICEGAYSQNGGFDGISFAIPGGIASFVARELKRHGRVQWPYLGISFERLTAPVAQKIGVSPDQTGAIVTWISPGTPAERAGVRVADVLIGVDAQPIADEIALGEQIQSRG